KVVANPPSADASRAHTRAPMSTTTRRPRAGRGSSQPVDRRSQYDDGGGVDRGKRDAARGCLDAGKRARSALARSLLTASDAQKPYRASSPTGSGSPGIALLAG